MTVTDNTVARSRQLVLERYLSSYPGEAAANMENLPAAEVVKVLQGISPKVAAAVLERLTPDGRTCARASAESQGTQGFGGLPRRG